MNSFAVKLLLRFVGLIIFGLLAVYFLFNGIVSNFIRLEAERELRNSQAAIIEWFNISPDADEKIVIQSVDISLEYTEIIEIAQPFPSPLYALGSDFIIIGEHIETVFPLRANLQQEYIVKIGFMRDFFFYNQHKFDSGNIVRFINSSSTYYVSAIAANLLGYPVFYLVYTDVSSKLDFRNSVNRVLIVLLIGLATISIINFIVASKELKREMLRLSKYAENIGCGNFRASIDSSKHTEFQQLSSSMTKMADMLIVYEKNQKQFFQNISHELKTPLMSIQSYADGILESVCDNKTAADIILLESEKMDNLISELLYISRLDGGFDMPNTFYDVDVRSLLYDCCDRLRAVAESSKKQFVIDLSGEKLTAYANEKSLERVFMNILTNCIRYAKRYITINYSIKGEYLEVLIEDDGEGVDPIDLPHIFERFYTGKFGKTGLGLAICKDILESLSGNIQVENLPSPQHGAKFTILLKLKDDLVKH